MGLITNLLSDVSAAPLSPSHVLTISTVTGERGRGDIIDLSEEYGLYQYGHGQTLASSF